VHNKSPILRKLFVQGGKDAKAAPAKVRKGNAVCFCSLHFCFSVHDQSPILRKLFVQGGKDAKAAPAKVRKGNAGEHVSSFNF
jgi:hypothetical protein